jgi:hypothetical protein
MKCPATRMSQQQSHAKLRKHEEPTDANDSNTIPSEANESRFSNRSAAAHRARASSAPTMDWDLFSSKIST